MAQPLTVGGLFSGIGGWELGLERAGMEIAWHCEADPFCRRVLERHWPGVPCFEDVKTLSDPPYVDVLAGGFPCQDLSVAGYQAGLDGERSGLWAEMLRLACEIRPRYVLIENVSALLTGDGGGWMRRLLCDLAACGFDAEWDCLPASAFGAPHQRDRIWIVAYPNDESDQAERGQRQDPSGEGSGRRDGARRSGGDAQRQVTVQGAGEDSSLSDAAGARLERGEQPAPTRGTLRELARRNRDAGGTWASEPVDARVAYGLPDWVDRMHALGNALVPQIAEWIGRRMVAYEEAQRV